MTINPDSVSSLRGAVRSFKRSASRLQDGIRLLSGSVSLKFSMGWKEGSGINTSFDETQSLIRLAALLRPFMASLSPLELFAVWKRLGEDAGLVDDTTREAITKLFAESENLGFVVVLNGKTLTARDLYFAYAEGEFFDENLDAKKLLDTLSFGPMQQIVPFLFYSVCTNYSKLVFAILDVVLDIERRYPELAIPLASEPRCICCLTRDRDFGSEEHVIPEAFGNDELVLHDAVCQTCNNELSKFDQFLVDFEPLALLRVQNVPLTKKGKFPRAGFRDFVLEKAEPRLLRFTSRTNKDVFVKEDLPDGSFRLSLSMTSRIPIDFIRLARSLFKIGLGLVAYDRGVGYACENRFDPARGFIRGDRMMPNHLLMSRNVRPDPSISTVWHSSDADTIVVLEMFGVGFSFNLEPSSFGIPDEAPPDMLQAFWLGQKTRKGVVPPCHAKCNHP